MNIYLRLGAALAAVSSLSACATITRGTQQKFEIKTVPPGADVTLSTGMTCKTPCRLKLRRKEEFNVHIEMAGYQPVDVQVESKMHAGGGAALAGNVLIGGLVGGVLDGTNGSLRDLKPNPVEVTLVPIGAEPAAVAPAEAAAPATTEAPAAPAATPQD
ncbi:PEGA domain-containing protein [Sphingomonas sp. AOB5]|uniref:PEGA domain-containing protein n=1 Tax=Sphingomonas sp. AOB5 TaxID=3034017 RepID=UPI0023F8B2B0|nr:PEGA domain-containing protein [Sphingomonas sp. AOB5]MDF7777376.1 PEGA domain-containing protein [Sphingomonas sp. AOB5]